MDRYKREKTEHASRAKVLTAVHTMSGAPLCALPKCPLTYGPHWWELEPYEEALDFSNNE